ncbi:two-component system regulatory protein YycI [Macrococcus equipercicus]|uniref:Two-component system regulatory protein YycI n=1 Tax=Macrococcus equipercicus TaxID=69967 RepID=A0A9Q9BTQ3_9STAP|nr:two-component system regulatory protein YycI [Macrococcus equipercicus]UTH13821.1 two-component system regulatory protein YycI [Macrococcus equipercicus]
MDWKHASSLFIFVFLVMNICLGYIYYNKVQQSHKIDTQDEKTLSFTKENIKLPKMLPTKDVELNYVSGTSKVFYTGDKDKKKATVVSTAVNKTIYLPKIEAPVIAKALDSYIDDEIYEGSEYILSGIDRKNKRIYYEQMFENYPILSNETAQIMFEYDSNNMIKSYKQTYLDDLQIGLGKNNEKKQVIEPRQALETLYYQNVLHSGDEVEAVRLGYYSVSPNIEGQVLKPTWQVAIIHNSGKHETVYVDALQPEETILK